MNEELDIYQGKSVGELGQEALWFFLHTSLAVVTLLLVMLAGTTLNLDPDSTTPKLAGTALAFLAPMVAGLLVMRFRHDYVARYVWISGLLVFSVVCVWVLDLPTGNGLCEHCGAVDKLWRTFFSIQHGSGLMGGLGLVVGTWVPFSLFGYAAGARISLNEEPHHG